MPWSLRDDMAYFKELTSCTNSPNTQNAVIMGRKTWESIPVKHRPLRGRLNIVLTRSSEVDQENVNSLNVSNQTAKPDTHAGALTASSFRHAIEILSSTQLTKQVETVFVIGGGQIYREALSSQLCSAIHLTSIEQDYDCDTFFPEFDRDQFRLWSASPPRREGDVRYSFLCYTNLNNQPTLPPGLNSKHEEHQYTQLVDTIVKTGVYRSDRTGTGNFSIFGTTMRFNLRHTFPLLTTKRVFFRGVLEELLWFIGGKTDARLLSERGVHIWDGNSSRAFLDAAGLGHREEGDLGPVYGFQWRHFGAEYTDMHADYTGQGVDQLAEVVRRIKEDPNDRRIVLTAWNPAALRHMALPPCHMFCQFYVAEGEVSCAMYQRSCDVGLGVPFNIASYALLTRIIAQVCGLRAGELVHMMGDTHVYANHVEPLKKQLSNSPRHFPLLRLNPDKTELDSFTPEDFTLSGYNPHPTIKMQMAV